VRLVAQKGVKENAAIASEEAARVYGLAVLKHGIEADVQNYTRFVVIARQEAESPAPASGARSTQANKASLCFAVADTPGSLFKALKVLSEHGLNMKKLESRPILGKPWQYLFYVDVDLPADPSVFSKTMKGLEEVTEDLRILGTYRV
jgi:prephenate dehydratase